MPLVTTRVLSLSSRLNGWCRWNSSCFESSSHIRLICSCFGVEVYRVTWCLKMAQIHFSKQHRATKFLVEILQKNFSLPGSESVSTRLKWLQHFGMEVQHFCTENQHQSTVAQCHSQKRSRRSKAKNPSKLCAILHEEVRVADVQAMQNCHLVTPIQVLSFDAHPQIFEAQPLPRMSCVIGRFKLL